MGKNNLLSDVAKYYSDKLIQHGESPRGVDWNGEESQTERFKNLCKIVDAAKPFSVNDLGCGYGALLDFLLKKYRKFSYLGIDVSENMVFAGEKRHKDCHQARFILGSEPDQAADYCLASGIFNVRLDKTDNEWWHYLENTLDVLDRSSHLGFAFNCLTSYSDKEKMRDYLYYANPCRIFDLCKRRYSRDVALLHDYGLYEFTILVRKKP